MGETGWMASVNGILLCEISGERPPHDRQIDFAVRDGIDQPRRRIRLAISAVQAVAHDLTRQALRRQQMPRRRIIIAHHVQTDAQIFAGADRSANRSSSLRSARDHEHVSGAVIRPGQRDALSMSAGTPRTASHKSSLSEFLRKTLALGPPDVLRASPERSSAMSCASRFSNPSPAFVGERKIVRIGADAKYALASGGDAKRRTEQDQD